MEIKQGDLLWGRRVRTRIAKTSSDPDGNLDVVRRLILHNHEHLRTREVAKGLRILTDCCPKYPAKQCQKVSNFERLGSYDEAHNFNIEARKPDRSRTKCRYNQAVAAHVYHSDEQRTK